MVVTQWFDPHTMRRHGFAVLTVALALAFRIYLGEAHGPSAPLLCLALSVTLGAWYGGLGPGLLATALGAATAAYFIIPPLYSFRIANGAGWLQLAVFASEGIVISVLCEARRRTAAALSLAQARDRTAGVEIARLRREIERLRTSHARTRVDLDHLIHALRHGCPSAGLLEYAAATEVRRSQRVDCNAVLDSIMDGSGPVTHDPLPVLRGDEQQLRALFSRLLRNGSGLRPAHITAGYQGSGWTLRIQYADSHAAGDSVAARIVEGHDGILMIERDAVRIHIPRRPQ